VKPMPLNLGYDPECRSCEQGMREQASHLGGSFRAFCDCVKPLPPPANDAISDEALT